MTRVLAKSLLLTFTVSAYAQIRQLKSITVDKLDGGSVTVSWGSVVLNANSTLHRNWYSLNDSSSPVQLVGGGVRIQPSPRATYLTYETQVTSVVANEPISALELRFALFDLFGDHIATIRELHVLDVPAAGSFQLKPWASGTSPGQKPKKQPVVEERPPGALEASPAEVQRLLHVATFVARVKSKSGVVWNADLKSISAELSRVLGTSAPEQTLQPTRDRK
jgi:hypothetical protein